MDSLLEALNSKAMRLGVPISAHLDVTYRCNERCVHCYLDHNDAGEMSLAELSDLLRQMADAGVLFLTISGGEPMLRRDLYALIKLGALYASMSSLSPTQFLSRKVKQPGFAS
jgi:AdoMet-dependent heme synthase